MRAAIKVISRFIKMVRMRKFLRSIKDHKKIEAGIQIQKYLKGFKVNKDYFDEKVQIKLYRHIRDWDREKEKRIAWENQCASYIQKNIRDYIKRKKK